MVALGSRVHYEEKFNSFDDMLDSRRELVNAQSCWRTKFDLCSLFFYCGTAECRCGILLTVCVWHKMEWPSNRLIL
jgi:hypothetical protein